MMVIDQMCLWIYCFSFFQSSNVDILARALELSCIPSDSNNDVLSQAMELSGINADTLKDL